MTLRKVGNGVFKMHYRRLSGLDHIRGTTWYVLEVGWRSWLLDRAAEEEIDGEVRPWLLDRLTDKFGEIRYFVGGIMVAAECLFVEL